MARRFKGGSADRRAGFWFTALTTALLGPVLVVIVLLLDHSAGRAGVFAALVISPTSARTILGSIAGSLITIASLTSSLTIVTLQLLSSQYTPRAIRGFLSTRLSQVVFGTFIGIFVYCLLLLVAIRQPGEANEPFVPSLGVLLAIVLALGSLGLLVVFVHRLSQLIQVSTMTSSVTRDTLAAIDHVHRWPFGRDVVARPDSAGWTVLRSDRPGYVQRLDVEGLLAAGVNASIEIRVRPGDFVTTGAPVLAVLGADADLAACVVVRPERDIDQDPIFGVRQLVDIAVRALSPGINDPSTAVTCILYLQEILETIVVRDLPGWVSLNSTASVTAAGRVLADYLEPTREIATYGFSDPRVKRELLATLNAVAVIAAEAEADAPGAAVRAFAATL